MLEEPRIVQTQEQLTSVIRLTIPRDQIRSVMGPAIGEVIAAVTAQGVTPAGAVFSYHHRMDPQVFDFEVGIPVPTPLAPTGRVKPSRLPARTVARTVYHGPYEGLGAAWGEFCQWMTDQGHESAGDFWECYVAGPESSPDPSNWRTELNRPLVRPA
jgi:effector-binding domain-containing protein